MKERNIFTESLKYAYEHIKPFSYVELTSHLLKESLIPEHYNPDLNYPEITRIYQYIIGVDSYVFNTHRFMPYPPTGDALSRYLEFVELEESRKTSVEANENVNKANKHAMKAIRIAVWALIAQVLLGLIGIALNFCNVSDCLHNHVG